jgi:hypothetical protein
MKKPKVTKTKAKTTKKQDEILKRMREEEKLMKGTRRYVAHVPRNVPDGWIVVHNHVNPVEGRENVPLGWSGFRAWLAVPGAPGHPKYVVCRCAWAPHLERHYRVAQR